MSSEIILPGIMQIGGGACGQLPQVMARLGCQRALIITDKTMVKIGVTARITDVLDAEGVRYEIFDDVMPEPDDTSITAAVTQARDGQFDCLVALGGGSAIDSAKAIALLATHGGHMRDYKVPHVVTQKSMPVIAIPTTAGTGSECTRVTIISDSASAEKMLCMGPGLIPSAAIVDYELTLSVPFRVAADTGIDALTHAIEAYVSRKANAFSDQQAIAAMRLIAPNLITACEQPDNREAKEALMLGSCLAGMAFSNASVCLVHGMSRPLGVHFHVPHGMSNAMLLPAVTRYSLTGAPVRYAECAQIMGLVSNIADIDYCHEELLNLLTSLNATLSVPLMSEFGIDEHQYRSLIPTMAEQALASGSPLNNPTVPDTAAMAALYQQVYA
ncbi:iron-containing alcohol dehydrogenase [Alteromonas sp. CYL-A6]|uniref:iron-containing alcohol dehydrogenase n=1 Tax=Alteromonas nitratireducens TaxID=3390813 RepID=UPI0034B8DB92